MPGFVLLYHSCPNNFERPSHWDLMLEVGDVLRTWALCELPHAWHAAQRVTATIDPTCPRVAADNIVAAQQLADHRQAYLQYEGPLSGDRGQVHRIDHGTYTGELTSPRCWLLELQGGMIRGMIVLQCASTDDKQWVLRRES
jgi:hypothetical protein